MKTIHSLFLAIAFFCFSFSSFAAGPWPEISMPLWELKEQKLTVSWTADSDAADIAYVIEKSQDGKNFSTAAILLGGFQNKHQFEFTYRLRHETGMHYRIRQVNKEGAARVVDMKSL